MTGWMAWGRPPAATAAGVTYANVSFPRDVEPVLTLASGFGVSPDGRCVHDRVKTAGGVCCCGR